MQLYFVVVEFVHFEMNTICFFCVSLWSLTSLAFTLIPPLMTSSVSLISRSSKLEMSKLSWKPRIHVSSAKKSVTRPVSQPLSQKTLQIDERHRESAPYVVRSVPPGGRVPLGSLKVGMKLRGRIISIVRWALCFA